MYLLVLGLLFFHLDQGSWKNKENIIIGKNHILMNNNFKFETNILSNMKSMKNIGITPGKTLGRSLSSSEFVNLFINSSICILSKNIKENLWRQCLKNYKLYLSSILLISHQLLPEHEQIVWSSQHLQQQPGLWQAAKLWLHPPT